MTAAHAINRWMKGGVAIALGWIALVLIVAIVQSTTYTGLVAGLSEWQFDHLGQSFSTMTFLLLFALFALPGLLLLGFIIRRINVAGAVRVDTLVVQRSARMLGVLGVLATLLGIAALIFVIQWAMLPTDRGGPRRVEMRLSMRQAPAPSPDLSEGPTRLIGRYRYDRIATFRRSVLVARRDYRFVPVEPKQPRAGSAISVFAETSPFPDGRHVAVEEHVGVLRRGGLPPAVAHLYRDAGFRIAPDVYVLYPDRRALTWPYIAGATQLALAAVLLAIAALLTRRRLRLLRGAPPAVTEPVVQD